MCLLYLGFPEPARQHTGRQAKAAVGSFHQGGPMRPYVFAPEHLTPEQRARGRQDPRHGAAVPRPPRHSTRISRRACRGEKPTGIL